MWKTPLIPIRGLVTLRGELWPFPILWYCYIFWHIFHIPLWICSISVISIHNRIQVLLFFFLNGRDCGEMWKGHIMFFPLADTVAFFITCPANQAWPGDTFLMIVASYTDCSMVGYSGLPVVIVAGMLGRGEGVQVWRVGGRESWVKWAGESGSHWLPVVDLKQVLHGCGRKTMFYLPFM